MCLQIRAILNKISSVNFTKLRKRWLSLIPNDTDLLNEVIRLAVSKAIDEPMFQCIYSRLISNAISSKPSCIAKSLHRTLMNHIHVLLQVNITRILIQAVTPFPFESQS